MTHKLVIGHLFPDLLNMYSDKGNVMALQNRMLWRGFDMEVKEFNKEDEIDLGTLDIVLLGGGSDREQRVVCETLRPLQSALQEYVESNGVLLATCGGYPLLGRTCVLQEETVEGLHLLDIYTEAGDKRKIGNVVLSEDAEGQGIVGFENHSTKTFIGQYAPLGKVVCGFGNNGTDGTCGVTYKNVIGTYLHGPLLPKNPALADRLLKAALERKYGEEITLPALQDEAEKAAHDYVVNRFAQKTV